MSSKTRSSITQKRHGLRPSRNSQLKNWPGRASVEDRWERMIDKVAAEIREGLKSAKIPRFLSEEACWKRNIYTFTLANIKTPPEARSLKRYVEGLILGKMERRLPQHPKFEDNPFHWVFSALAANGDWVIDRRNIFRFGRHLRYAMEHHVPEEFLIGFLFQAGTPSEVEKKAGSGATEVWRDRWITACRP